MRLYDYLPSGNGYKVRLLLAQLGLAYERIELDIVQGATHTPAYLAKNPNGRIPMLELDDGRCLPESNAILFYLAHDTPFLPSDRWLRAQVLQWMCFEQYSHEPNIATVRFWLHTQLTDERRALLPGKRAAGYAALDVMEQHLGQHPFFVGQQYTIADIALYAYTHVAEEGEFDLGRYPAIRAWCTRVGTQPGHIPITQG
jgi:glutathione S-transferase